jgi:hypothetical protein
MIEGLFAWLMRSCVLKEVTSTRAHPFILLIGPTTLLSPKIYHHHRASGPHLLALSLTSFLIRFCSLDEPPCKNDLYNPPPLPPLPSVLYVSLAIVDGARRLIFVV